MSGPISIAPVCHEGDAIRTGVVHTRVIRTVAEIEALGAEWQALADNAVEPNVFYEPWMCLAALRGVASCKDLEVALVHRDGGALIGVFPLVRTTHFRGVPAVSLRSFRHDYSFLATPLVHRAHASECIHAFLDWLRDASDTALLELEGISGDGPFHHALIDALNERREVAYVAHRESRAVLRRRPDAEAYLSAALDGNARRKLRSKERALARSGRIEYATLASDADIAAWTADFLTLEATGWKGRAATAMALVPAHRAFFETAVAEAARRRQLMMLALCLDGRPVAMKCNFLCGEGSFAFKIAYDETHARSSPGMLLELENIRRMHETLNVSWMDSCAKSSSRLFRELWIDRRTIETLVIATGKERGRLLLSLVPFARWMKRSARGSLVGAASALGGTAVLERWSRRS